MDIFISYSRADRDRVAHIAKGLQDEGYEVWWDRDIRAGEEFDHVIDKAIKQSKAIVVVWSNSSIKSRWVKEEAEDGIEGDTLVPVTIDDIVIPRGFRRIQAAELQDGGDNPASSVHWDEFLYSVRQKAGSGGSTEASAEPPQPRPVSTAPARPVAAMSAAGASGGSKPAWQKWVPLGAGALAAIAALVFAFSYFSGPSAPPPPEDMTPVVLGIYPNESFGDDQRLGLTSAFSDSDIDVIHLSATLDQMKGRDAPELIEALEANLLKRNVVAIVGPSITELTPEVLQTVEDSGRKPAIILTTAAPRAVIGWDESDLPLFRVGSGVDERARQFALLAKNTIASGTELVLLYESAPNSTEKTYGEVFFDRIKDNLPEWSSWLREGKAHDISYLRGDVMASLDRPEQQAHFNSRKMIVVVGLSGDYIALVANMYRGDQPARSALLGGWNTSKALRDLGREMDVQHTRLFDMTDVLETPAEVRDFADSRRFERDFGDLNPAKRQEAVAYDSGLVVKQAAARVDGEVTADKLVTILREGSFTGITGEIVFAENGQNTGQVGGRSFYNLVYDPASEGWGRIQRFDSLLAQQVAAR